MWKLTIENLKTSEKCELPSTSKELAFATIEMLTNGTVECVPCKFYLKYIGGKN